MIILSMKGQYFRIWDEVLTEKLQNEQPLSGLFEVSIKEMFFLYGVMSFVLSWSIMNVNSNRSPYHFILLMTLR